MTWVQAGSVGDGTLVVRSDGRAFMVGPTGTDDGWTSLAVPDLPDGVTYIQIPRGEFHYALLRSDGRDLPGAPGSAALCFGGAYTAVSANGFATALHFARA